MKLKKIAFVALQLVTATTSHGINSPYLVNSQTGVSGVGSPLLTKSKAGVYGINNASTAISNSTIYQKPNDLGCQDIPTRLKSNSCDTTVIDKPGSYLLVFDIDFSPTEVKTEAIKITSNDVLLDLNKKSISCKSEDTITGIKIAPGLSNVMIENGSIRKFTSSGIVFGSGCDHIVLKNIHIHGCLKNGLETNQTNFGRIHSCHFMSNKNDAVVATGCNQMCFEECSFGNEILPTTPTASHGLTIVECSSSIASNCTALNVKNAESSGFLLKDSDDCCFHECVSHTNIGTTSSYGFALENSDRNLVEGCSSYNNYSNENTSGFSLKNSNYNTIVSCSSGGNKAQYKNGSAVKCTGFETLGGKGNIFSNCMAYANGAIGTDKQTTKCIGFYIKNSPGTIMYESISHFNLGSVGLGTGIFIDQSQSCVFRGNSLTSNRGSSGSYGLWDTSTNCSSWIGENESFAHTTANYKVTFKELGEELNVLVATGTGKLGDLSGVSPHQNIDVRVPAIEIIPKETSLIKENPKRPGR